MNGSTDTAAREHPQLPALELSGEPLLAALTDPSRPEGAWAIWAAQDYWESGRFTGAEFDRLGLGPKGLDPEPDAITATDIVAVSMLEVNVPAVTSRDLLGRRADEVRRVLGRVPVGPLHEVDRAEVEVGSPAFDLWHLVRNREQAMGRTTTSKLLARKRPHLLPVYDSRVQRRLGLPINDWAYWWDWWSKPNHVAAMQSLRDAADAGWSAGSVRDVSLLRILDVIVWRYDVDRNPKPRAATTDR